jgi:Secretion system C-terminal sorting domain/PKD-like domain/Putative serine esterase (DUF676)
MKPEQEAGSNNINEFFRDVRQNASGSFLLENEINSYDVIYVDWNNGVTFLQRNAYVLQEVIKWVNDNKTTTTENVVLGQSMGGLIARYALKDMENRGLPHDTRLYVSHDAPHLGANTPVSVQMSARHLRNLYVNTPVPLVTGEIIVPLIYNFAEGFSSIINFFGGNTTVPPFITPLQAFSLADTPATRQMTYNWVNFSSGIDTTIHDAWQQDLANIGYPAGKPAKPIRNIAIANGSECGVTQTDNGNIMSYVKDAGRDTFLSNYIGILDAVYGSILLNPVVVVAALFPGSSYWKIDFQSKYMTSLNENKNIYKGYIGYKKKVFWFIPVSIAVTDVNRMQPTGVLPYDIYGGGIQRTSPSQLPISGIISNGFGFIPTASSLDIGKWTTPINDTDYRRSFVGGQPPVAPKNSPFQNFVTGFVENNPTASNSRHISFNTRNGNWLQTELSVTTPDQYTNCSYMCSTSQISGIDAFCTSAIYSASASGATTYNWTITQGASLVTIAGNGTSTVTLTVLPNASGTVTLSLTAGGTCGNVTLAKSIQVGTRILNTGLVAGASEVNFNETLNYSYGGEGLSYNEVNYNWFIYGGLNDGPNGLEGPDGGAYIVDGQGTPSIVLETGSNLGYIVVEVTAATYCDLIDTAYLFVDVTNPFTRSSSLTSASTITIFPNPLTNLSTLQVNINTANINDLGKYITKIPSKSGEYQVKIYDFYGNLKHSASFKTNQMSMNNLNLEQGKYVLNVNTNSGEQLKTVLLVK